jgi:hypothetical protein
MALNTLEGKHSRGSKEQNAGCAHALATGFVASCLLICTGIGHSGLVSSLSRGALWREP